MVTKWYGHNAAILRGLRRWPMCVAWRLLLPSRQAIMVAIDGAKRSRAPSLAVAGISHSLGPGGLPMELKARQTVFDDGFD
jgi:hypothetical protein